MISAICDDPVIEQYDYTKCPYFLMDFSTKRFIYVICPSGNNPDSLATIHSEMDGGDCDFFVKDTKLDL